MEKIILSDIGRLGSVLISVLSKSLSAFANRFKLVIDYFYLIGLRNKGLWHNHNQVTYVCSLSMSVSL